MKKIKTSITTITALLLTVLFLVGCTSVTVGSFSSKYFNNDDYDSAVEEVQIYFKDFKGCTLSKIGYAGDDAVKEEAKERNLANEQVMVLTTTFTTDDDIDHDGLKPNETYEDYQWILTRNTSNDLWEIEEHGAD